MLSASLNSEHISLIILAFHYWVLSNKCQLGSGKPKILKETGDSLYIKIISVRIGLLVATPTQNLITSIDHNNNKTYNYSGPLAL